MAVPLYLVTICTTEEPISFLKTQLVYIHNLLTFAVSAKVWVNDNNNKKHELDIGGDDDVWWVGADPKV